MEALTAEPRTHHRRPRFQSCFCLGRSCRLVHQFTHRVTLPRALLDSLYTCSQILQLIVDSSAFDCLCLCLEYQILLFSRERSVGGGHYHQVAQHNLNNAVLRKANRGSSCDLCGSRAKHRSSVLPLCPSVGLSLSPGAGWHLGSPSGHKRCHSAVLSFLYPSMLSPSHFCTPCGLSPVSAQLASARTASCSLCSHTLLRGSVEAFPAQLS